MLLVRAKGKYDRTWGKEQADRGRDTGVVVDLGGRGWILGELSGLYEKVSGLGGHFYLELGCWSVRGMRF